MYYIHICKKQIKRGEIVLAVDHKNIKSIIKPGLIMSRFNNKIRLNDSESIFGTLLEFEIIFMASISDLCNLFLFLSCKFSGIQTQKVRI